MSSSARVGRRPGRSALLMAGHYDERLRHSQRRPSSMRKRGVQRTPGASSQQRLRVDARSFAAGARHVLDVGAWIQMRLSLEAALAAKLEHPIAQRAEE